VGFLVDEAVSPFDAIRGATSLAAEMLGIDDRTGAIEVGLDGDFILI
jgi:imidazolonepropionase-like amidohydrolase